MNISTTSTHNRQYSREATIMTMFFLHAMASSALFTRIPDIQQAIGMNDAQLGLTLIGQPIGAFCMYFIASQIIDKVGTRLIAVIFIPLLAIVIILLALAPNMITASLCFAAFGASFALSNISMNVEADRVEAATDNKVMNRCHGLWSLGFLLASLIGVAARALDVSVWLHYTLTLPIVLFVTWLVIWPMTPSPERDIKHNQTKKPLFATPTFATLALVSFGISAVLLESGTRTWAIIYMRDSFNAADWVDSLTLPAFFFTMAVGRIFSDKWIQKYGPRKIALITISIAITGLSLIILAQNLVMALGGFGLLGLGICVVYPLTISAAAQIGDRQASLNVTSVTMVISLAMLAAPAIMGLIADQYGIKASFAVIMPWLIISLLLTKLLKS